MSNIITYLLTFIRLKLNDKLPLSNSLEVLTPLVFRGVLFFGIGISCLLVQAFPASKLTIGQTPVIDQAGALSSAQTASLNKKLHQWQAQNIMQGAVVIVDSTDGEDTFHYALSIAERWQLGSAERDNGLLMLIAIKDRQLQILTGYGLEGALPDISVKRIIRDNITPAFKANNHFQGIEQGLNAIVGQLTADADTQRAMINADNVATTDSNTNNFVAILFIPTYIVTLLLSALLGRILAGIVGAGTIFTVGTTTFGASALEVGLISGFFLLFFLLPSSSGTSNLNNSSHHHSGSRSSSRSSYRGGGGGFGGGGAGGSW